jgi:hypothetical protein
MAAVGSSMYHHEYLKIEEEEEFEEEFEEEDFEEEEFEEEEEEEF